MAKSAKKAHAPRNKLLGGGINRYSRSVMYAKRYAFKKRTNVTKVEKKQLKALKEKNIGGEKNGKTRLVRIKRMVSGMLNMVYCVGETAVFSVQHNSTLCN